MQSCWVHSWQVSSNKYWVRKPVHLRRIILSNQRLILVIKIPVTHLRTCRWLCLLVSPVLNYPNLQSSSCKIYIIWTRTVICYVSIEGIIDQDCKWQYSLYIPTVVTVCQHRSIPLVYVHCRGVREFASITFCTKVSKTVSLIPNLFFTSNFVLFNSCFFLLISASKSSVYSMA